MLYTILWLLENMNNSVKIMPSEQKIPVFAAVIPREDVRRNSD